MLSDDEKNLVLVNNIKAATIALRNRTSLSLKEAKDQVDLYAIEVGVKEKIQYVGSGNVSIRIEALIDVYVDEEDFDKLVKFIGDTLNVEFKIESSGRFEEFEAYVSSFIGIECSILKIPNYLIENGDKRFQIALGSQWSKNNNVVINLNNYIVDLLLGSKVLKSAYGSNIRYCKGT